jgi:hypothetical protein
MRLFMNSESAGGVALSPLPAMIRDGKFDVGNRPALVHVAYGRAAADIAGGIDRDHHLAHAGDGFRFLIEKFFREPDAENRVGDRFHALGADRGDAGVPGVRRLALGRGIGKDHALEALGRRAREPHAGHAAHGEAAVGHTRKFERVENRQDIAAEPLDRIGAVRRAGLAVAALIVADDAKVFGECLRLLVPHVQVGSERIGEHEDRRAGLAFNFHIDRSTVGVDHRHQRFFPFRFEFRASSRSTDFSARSMKCSALPR